MSWNTGGIHTYPVSRTGQAKGFIQNWGAGGIHIQYQEQVRPKDLSRKLDLEAIEGNLKRKFYKKKITFLRDENHEK